LMLMRQEVGTAIGHAARLYQGLYEADCNLPWEWLVGCRSYWKESFGRGYVDFVAERFPELEALRGAMNTAVRTPTVEEAGSNLDAQLALIATNCGCKYCYQEKPENSELKAREFCLVFLAHAIMVISRALSGVCTSYCHSCRTQSAVWALDKIWAPDLGCTPEGRLTTGTCIRTEKC
jgi:hypothetical protein